MRCPLALLAVYAAFIANVMCGAEVALLERPFLNVGGVTVYFSQQDEVFARRFAESLPQIARAAQEDLRLKRSDPAVLAVKSFRARRDEYLKVIAHYLGLKRPQPVNLDENPENLSATQQAAAYAVFRTIAEKHGNEAVTKLLAAFWKLKPAQRTSQSFARICEKQLKQPLAAYLPRGVVIEAGG